MKKILTGALLLLSLHCNAQLVTVQSTQKVPLTANVYSEVAVVSPDATFAIIGEMGGTILKKVDLATGVTSVLTDNGNINGLRISPDGSKAVYRKVSFDASHRRYQALVSLDIATLTESEVIPASRRLNSGSGISDSGAAGVADGKYYASPSGVSIPAFASINLGHLEVCANGKNAILDPSGKGSYMWPSVSPDGTKVAYFKAGAGAFVANIDGTNARSLGYLHAPTWLGNNLIIGMEDISQAQRVQSSKIVIVGMDGTRQTISDSSIRALYPSVSADGTCVIYSDFNGELYKATIKL